MPRSKAPTPADLARLAMVRARTPRASRAGRGVLPPASAPVLTADHAMTFAKMLSAGVPALTAIVYFSPAYAKKARKRDLRTWLQLWASDPLVIAAVTTLNNGEWHELQPEQRLQVALDKHDAEQAWFLYTNNFVKAVDDLTLQKMKTARESLRQRLTANVEGNRENAYREMLRDIMDGKLGPPQFAEIGESVPSEVVAQRVKRTLES